MKPRGECNDLSIAGYWFLFGRGFAADKERQLNDPHCESIPTISKSPHRTRKVAHMTGSDQTMILTSSNAALRYLAVFQTGTTDTAPTMTRSASSAPGKSRFFPLSAWFLSI